MPVSFSEITKTVDWHPRVGQPFSFKLFKKSDQGLEGSLQGEKVVLYHIIAMNCPACHSLSGIKSHNPKEGIVPQKGLKSIGQYFEEYANLGKLQKSQVSFVQIALRNFKNKIPKKGDLQKWANLVKPNFGDNYQLWTSKSFIRNVDLIPGFVLVDKNGKVRSIVSNKKGSDNLYKDLLPMIKTL